MKATEKKARLDDFARSMDSVVSKYQCFGIHENTELCKQCTVKKQCKAQTPKGAKK